MGWAPDIEEFDPILTAHRAASGRAAQRGELAVAAAQGEAEAMGSFWAGLYEIALDNVAGVPGVSIVSHEELAGGGAPAAQRLFAELGLPWSRATEAEFAREAVPAGETDARALHNFDRPPAAVAGAWRQHLQADEVRAIESVTEGIRQRLHEARLPLEV
jgi:hypothetical protein